MSRKKGILKITLKSDLCVASGYSYEGMVDTDVCYNNNGIPYISGRRIKGCLRDAAELIRLKNMAEVFGEGGSNGVRGIIVDNAWPENIDDINEELSMLKACNSEFADSLTRQDILEQFTHVKAQTQIDDNGIAKNNSLRYMRVVSRYSPFTGKENVFLANVEFDCDEAVVTRLAKALRNMGMDRNRGLGSVKCELIDVNEVKTAGATVNNSDDDTMVKLSFAVKNVQPLMMSAGADSRTEKYIGGQSVLGFFAGRYLACEGNTAEDELFKDIFLRGKVKFSNLYISDMTEDKLHTYVPAPLFVNRLKKTKVFVNMAADNKEATDNKYNEAGGNQPKKLKGLYVHFDEEGRVAVKEPDIEAVYHHSKVQAYEAGRNQENEESGILYSLEVLEEGQIFAGSIVARKRYTDVIKALMEGGRLRFGKSKSAQYGECKLLSLSEEKYAYEEELKAGEKVLVVLESDGIFCDDSGCYTIRAEEVKKAVADALGIEYEDAEDDIFLQAKLVSGYNTVWNLKKPDYQAIAAGSTIEYTVAKDLKITKEYVGSKQLEGYGKVKIYHMDKLGYALKAAESYTVKECEVKATKDILEKILFDRLMDSIRAGVYDIGKLNLTASKIGRVTLMLNEAINQGQDKAFDDFMKRVDSIKGKSEKSSIQTFLKSYICAGDYTLSVEKLLSKGKKPNDEAKSIYGKLTKLGVASLDDKVKSLWSRYLMDILVYQKYLTK